MPINSVLTSSDLDGFIYDAEYSNSMIIATGVIVSSDLGDAVRFGAGLSTVHVAGMVASTLGNAVEMGFGIEPSGAGLNKVLVFRDAVVTSAFTNAISLGGGNNYVFNAGVVASQAISAIRMGGDDCSIVNEGILVGGIQTVYFDASNNTSVNRLTNTGTIASENNLLSAFASAVGRDEVDNRGTIAGRMNFNDGDDFLDNENGTVTGIVLFGAGNDELIGGTNRERAAGGLGSDTLDFGGGNDAFLCGTNDAVTLDGNDDLDGGDGTDTYDARGIANTVTVRLHEQRAVGADIGHDVVVNFENVLGSEFGDSLVGDAGRNVLRGNGGADSFNGLEGNDRIFGDAGADIIVGNAGRDVMTGGAQNDVFDFNNVTDSAVGDSIRDIITDFATGFDDIDLATIDANTLLANDQAFAFIGNGAFTNVAGQLRYSIASATQYTTVEGDVNGDGRADFSIALLGSIALVAGDIVL